MPRSAGPRAVSGLTNERQHGPPMARLDELDKPISSRSCSNLEPSGRLQSIVLRHFSRPTAPKLAAASDEFSSSHGQLEGSRWTIEAAGQVGSRAHGWQEAAMLRGVGMRPECVARKPAGRRLAFTGAEQAPQACAPRWP